MAHVRHALGLLVAVPLLVGGFAAPALADPIELGECIGVETEGWLLYDDGTRKVYGPRPYVRSLNDCVGK